MDAAKLASYRGLLFAVAVAAALQAILVVRSPTITADGITFISIARQLPQQGAQVLRNQDQHPGFPAMLLSATRLLQLAGFHAEPEAWMRGGQIVACACGLLSVWVVWLFARDLFGPGPANLAALIFAVLPIPRASAADAVSDTPHLFFYLLAAWLASSAVAGGRMLLLAGAGAASGIAYWIRPEGLEVFVVALVWIVVQAVASRWPPRRLILAGTVLTAATAVIAMPYSLLAEKFTSKQVPAVIAKLKRPPAIAAAPPSAGPAAAFQGEPEHPPIVVDRSANGAAAASPGDPPPATTSLGRDLPRRLKPAWHATAAFVASTCQGFRWIFLPLFFIGHLELARRKFCWPQMGFIWALGATHAAILLSLFLVAGYIAHRHTLPLVALAMPCTALGVIHVGDIVARRLAMAPYYPRLAVLGVACAIVLPQTLRPFSREFSPVIEATRWVEGRADAGVGIVSNSPYVGFHGTLPVAMLGHRDAVMTLDAALGAAETPAHYDFVVLHVNAHRYRPEWIAQVEQLYRPVLEIPDPSSGKRAMKVLVFEAKARQARREAIGSRS